MIRIGIFDTGIGGVLFAKELRKHNPEYSIKVVHDRENLPYGDKSEKDIRDLVDKAIQPILLADIIVIACNTATAYAIDHLRKKYPEKTFVGFEPAIKIAATQTKTKCIAVLATPATLKSERYRILKSAYGMNTTIFEPQVKTLASQIETRKIDWKSLEALLHNLKLQHVDIIVLGCTHYHLIQNSIQQLVGSEVTVITPTQSVIDRIDKLTARKVGSPRF